MFWSFILFFEIFKTTCAFKDAHRNGTKQNFISIDTISGFLSINTENLRKNETVRIYNFHQQVIKLMYFEVCLSVF